MTPQERERRKQQSISSNPQKYYKACLKRGCCKNCSKNVEAETKVSTPTVFGSYFSSQSDGFGTTRKYRKCAASGEQIINEYNRCGMWEKQNNSETSAEVVSKIV